MPLTRKIVPVIPGSLNEDPGLWKRADILTFLNANKDELDLDDEDINTIRINKVAGLAFLKLTRKDLRKVYNLPDGSAIAIAELIKELIRTKQEVQKRGTGSTPPLPYVGKIRLLTSL